MKKEPDTRIGRYMDIGIGVSGEGTNTVGAAFTVKTLRLVKANPSEILRYTYAMAKPIKRVCAMRASVPTIRRAVINQSNV